MVLFSNGIAIEAQLLKSAESKLESTGTESITSKSPSWLSPIFLGLKLTFLNFLLEEVWESFRDILHQLWKIKLHFLEDLSL